MDKLSEKLLDVAAKFGMAYDDAEVMEAAANLARRVEEAEIGILHEIEVGEFIVVPEHDRLYHEPVTDRGQRVRLVREE